MGARTDLVVVDRSFGGFVGPLVRSRVPVALLVLVAAMVPAPGEPAQDWWANTGHDRIEPAGDAMITFLHDVPAGLAAEALRRLRAHAAPALAEPWPLEAWPDVRTRFLLPRHDRYFPAEFERRVARERLGIGPDEIDGDHCLPLSHPHELVDRLEAYAAM
jgi:hypothetical protein